MGQANVPTSSVRIDSFDAPRPLIGIRANDPSADTNAQGDNALSGMVTNDGQTVATIRVNFSAPGWRSRNYTFSAVFPGSSIPVSHDWEGPIDNASSVTIIMTAGIVVSEDMSNMGAQPVIQSVVTKQITRDVQWHNLTLTSISGWTPSDTIFRGGNASIARVLVRNNGSAPEVARVIAGGNLPAGWSFHTIPPHVTVAVGETVAVLVNATAPHDEVPGTRPPPIALNVLSNESRVVARRMDLPTYLDTMDVALPAVSNGTRLLIEALPAARNATPGEREVPYAVVVMNPTARAEIINIQVVNVSTDGNVTFNLTDVNGTLVAPNDRFTVAAASRVSFMFNASVNESALNRSHFWEIRANWSDRPESVIGSRVQLNVTEIFSGLGMEVPNLTISAVPGSMLEIPLNLTNFGNSVDRVCVEIDETPPDWNVSENCWDLKPLVAPVNNSTTIDGDGGGTGIPPVTGDGTGDSSTTDNAISPWHSTVQRNWSARLETWATSGNSTVNLTAISRSDPNEQRSTMQRVNVSVGNITYPWIQPPARLHPPILISPGGTRPNLTYQVPAPDCVAAVLPSQTIRLPVLLENQGNENGTFDLRIGTNDSQMRPNGWRISSSTGLRNMAYRVPNTVEVTVHAPAELEPGDHANFTLTLADTNTTAAHSIRCSIFASFADLTITNANVTSTATTPPELYAGHPASLHFHVSNIGWNATGGRVAVRSLVQGPAAFSLWQNHSLDPIGTWAGSPFRPLTVSFNATTPGTYTYSVVVDPEDEISEFARWPNSIAGSVELRDFGVTVRAPAGQTVIPEQTISFEGDSAFQVVNHGTRSHNLTISIEMEPAWRVFQPILVPISGGARYNVPVAFTVPEIPQASEVRVTVRVSNSTLPTLQHEATTRLRLDDDKPPVISEVAANASRALVGSPVRLSAKIRDAMGVAEARVYVVDPLGDVTYHRMTPAAPGEFIAVWSPTSVGPHQAHVWARDGSTSGNTADSRPGGVVEVAALPADRPDITLVTPANGSSIRAGTPLVFTVPSKNPLATADYALVGTAHGGHLDESRNPLEVHTAGWRDGRTTVEILVRDVLGAEARRTFTFMIDSAQPRVIEIALEPLDLAPGQTGEVVATIEGATRVLLRLQAADGRAQELPMKSRGTTSWTAEVAIPEGLTTIAVVAADAAGNEAYLETLFANPSPGGNFLARAVPGPTIATGLLILSLAAWTQSRRRGGRFE